MDTLTTFAIAAIILTFFLLSYRRSQKKTAAAAREAEEKGKLHSGGPQAQYPLIDITYCIGCAGCTTICPEGDVLAMIGGKAVIVNGHKCIGHSLCAEACPVGAITMVTSGASVSADMPYLTPERETSIPNLFIVGELGGLALIKNAVNEGRDCVDTITKRFAGGAKSAPGIYKLLIVGTGPAGVSAALRAAENKLNYLAVEQEAEVGGTVAKYPRQKLVMTSPVQFPTYGRFKKTELSKEELIAFWHKVMQQADFKVHTGEKVQDIKKGEDGIFTVVTPKEEYRARSVILALGKTGSPRKLGVKGEGLPKVMYRLIEADHYINKQILVVGGGDSAIEAAMGLGHQVGNKVTLSYRKESFSRIKERNTQRIQECMRAGTVKVVFNSAPVEFKENTVMFEVNGKVEEIPNDFVWIFAGGEPPTAFLKKIGIGFGMQDMTSQGSSEAKQAALAKRELAKGEASEKEGAKGEASEKELPQGVASMKQEFAKGEPGISGVDLAKPGHGIAGEDLARVAHRPVDAGTYESQQILVPAVANLAHRIVEASLRDAEALKPSIHAKDDKDQMQRWFLVVRELLYFFMHLTNRFSSKELGHEQRCKVKDQLFPLIVRPTIDSIFGHWPTDVKDRMEKDLIEKFNDAEGWYLDCAQKDALFSKFAEKVCVLLGTGKNHPAYAETFMKTMNLALASFNQLNLPETLRAIGDDVRPVALQEEISIAGNRTARDLGRSALR
jgi:thioredoxin reductase/Pyruvate/2-oxoacid:ferredoxin oxidoreductase delta subunit